MFDIDACRREFWCLVERDGAWNWDHITTNEDIHARWH